MSYYRIIDGQKYKAALLEAAFILTEKSGDGRISVADAEKLLAIAQDGRGLTLIEQKTLSYIQAHFKWTQAAQTWFQQALHQPEETPTSYDVLISKILADFEIKDLRTNIPKEEIYKQQEFTATILFETALREALRAFIEEEDDRQSPRDIVRLVEDLHPAFFPNEQAFEKAVEERVMHYMNQDGKLSLVPYSDGLNWDKTSFDPPQEGESIADNWVFSLHLPKLSDHVYWAIIDRKGQQESYAYGFN